MRRILPALRGGGITFGLKENDRSWRGRGERLSLLGDTLPAFDGLALYLSLLTIRQASSAP